MNVRALGSGSIGIRALLGTKRARSEPAAYLRAIRAHQTFGLFFILSLLTAGCAVRTAHLQTPDTPLQSKTLALSTPISPAIEVRLPPSGEEVLVWAEKGFDLFESGDYHLAAPYFEATLESDQTSQVQRTYLYWFSALSHHENANASSERRFLELFVLSMDNLSPATQGELWLVDQRGNLLSSAQALTRSRALLLVYRVERRQGFGATTEQAVQVRSLEEETLVLSQLRCDEARQERVELTDRRSVLDEGGRFDEYTVRCLFSGERRVVTFDITDVKPLSGLR